MIPIRRSVEIDSFVKAFGSRVHRVLREEEKPALRQGEQFGPHGEINFSLDELVVNLADIDAGNAPAGSEGKFWFVPGFSSPDGGDIVRS